MKSKTSRLGCFALLLCVLTASGQTVYTWTGNNSIPYDSYYVAANLSDAANWTGNVAPPSDGSATGSALVFGASNGANGREVGLNLSGDTAVFSLTFVAPFPNYYLSSGSYYSTLGIGAGGITVGGGSDAPVSLGYLQGLTLLAGQTWKVEGNLNLAVPISDETGTAGLTKTGGGTLIMQDTGSTFNGGLTVQAGTLEIGGNSNAEGSHVYSGPVGTGTLTLADNTTLGSTQNSDTTLGNALVLGNGVTIGNSYDSFRYNLTGPVTPLNAATRVILGSGNPVFFTGGIADAAGGPTTLTFSSAANSYSQGGGVAVLGGTNTYSGGTVADGAGVVFFTPSAVPASGSITAVNLGYVGTAYSGGMTDILGHITAPATFNGSLGFDTDAQASSSPTVFADAVNLSGFSNDIAVFAGLGTQTSAILTGPITPTAGGDYLFGGGGGTLQVQSDLTAATGVRVHSSQENSPLTVYLQGNNAFTGTLLVDHSVVVLDSASALPAGVGYQLDSSAYVGYTEKFTGAANAAAFISRLHAPNYNSTSVIGFDTTATNLDAPRTLSDPVDLHQLGDIYIGSATSVHLAGTITAPSTGQLSVTGVNGGRIAIDSPLAAANVTSLNVGGTAWKFSDRGYVELTSGASDFTGGTTLNSGYLLVGAGSTSNVDGTLTSGPLGTGTLTFNGQNVSNAPALAATAADVSLQNTIVFGGWANAQLGVPVTTNSSDPVFALQDYTNNNLTLTGSLSGNPGTLAIVGNGTVTLGGDNRDLNTSEFDIGTASGKDAPLVVAANDHALGSDTSMLCLDGGADLRFTTLSPTVGSLMGGDTNYGSVTNPSFIALLSGATLTINQTQDGTLAAVIGGTPVSYDAKAQQSVTDFTGGTVPAVNAALVKNGGASLTLTGQNTYSGGTTINAGTVVAGGYSVIDTEFHTITSGPLGTGPVTINGGQLAFAGTTLNSNLPGTGTAGGLSGTTVNASTLFANPIGFGPNGGSLSGNVTFMSLVEIGANASIAPGSGPGVMSFNAGLTFASGGTYAVDIADLAGTAGLGYDSLIVSGGTFSITATDNAPFTLRLTSISTLGLAGLLGHPSENPASLTVLQAPSAIGGFDGSNLVLDPTGFSSPVPGTFTLSVGGTNSDQLLLNFTPVPEPSTYALLLLGLGFVCVTARRRR